MIVLPVGVEDSVVRRTPWVTWTIMGLCLGLFLFLEVAPVGTSEREVDGRFGEALNYLGEHPYLTIPAPLERVVTAEGRAHLQALRESFDEAEVELAPSQVVAEQEELDALARDAQAALHGMPGYILGFVPADPRWYTLVTSLFMHAGWFHILGNLLFLFMSGPFIEDAYGRPLYSALYLFSGLVATAAHAMAAPASVVPLVGASGAIAGVMGAFLVRFFARRIELMVLPFIVPVFRFRLHLRAFVVLPLWIGEQVLYALLSPAGGGGVAFVAHIGGFFTGLLIALIIRFGSIEARFIDPAIENQISLAQHPGLERANDARAAGDLETARREIAAVIAAEPQNPDAWLESWEIAIAAGDGAATGQAGQRLLEIYGRAGETELGWSVAGDDRWRHIPGLPMRFVLAAGDFMGREGDGRGALDCYRIVSATTPQDALALRALVCEGETLAKAGDLTQARTAFEKAKLHPACSELWSERMERALKTAPR